MVTPCSTLEQRWSACRDRVYGDVPWHEEPKCQTGYDWDYLFDRRPCTSPRRHQCRPGGVQRVTLGMPWTRRADSHYCDNLPW